MKLLPDTGAEYTAVCETAAKIYKIDKFTPIKGTVAGGGAVDMKGLKAAFLGAGPNTQKGAKGVVLKCFGGPAAYNGRPDMSFLKAHKHTPDLKRKVIVRPDKG